MKVVENQNKKIVEEIRYRLKLNDGYCPCVLAKNVDTKCMCKDFRDKIANGYEGECHCGLYEVIR